MQVGHFVVLGNMFRRAVISFTDTGRGFVKCRSSGGRECRHAVRDSKGRQVFQARQGDEVKAVEAIRAA
jgi:hypothetical protein